MKSTDLKIGDWVSWHSKKMRRVLTGQIVKMFPSTAMVIWTTWDGNGHHWYVPYRKMRKVSLE